MLLLCSRSNRHPLRVVRFAVSRFSRRRSVKDVRSLYSNHRPSRKNNGGGRSCSCGNTRSSSSGISGGRSRYLQTTGNGNYNNSSCHHDRDGNLYTLFEERFRSAGDRAAFREEPFDGSSNGRQRRGRTVSYSDLVEHVARYANALEAEGVQPDDRVSVQVEKSVENVFLYLAVLKVGAVYHPLNTAYTVSEMEYFLSDAAPSLVVVDPEKYDAIQTLLDDDDDDSSTRVDKKKQQPPKVHTMNAAGIGSLPSLAKEQTTDHETVPRDGNDLASLLYTSGTTGRSKGAMLTHENLSSNAVTLHRIWGFRPGDVLLHVLPIYHVHGLYVALGTAFLNQSEIAWMPAFDAKAVVDVLPSCTVVMGVPTHYGRLLAAPNLTAAACRNVRLFVSGSAPMPPETHARFERRTGHRIVERYGMTETGMIASNPYFGDASDRVPGTVGYALPDVRVRVTSTQDDGTFVVVPNGQVGDVEVKGPNVFAGYWNMPEKTAEEIRPDGYFRTGDLAKMDDDGRVTLVGRSKDLIVSGGLNVYPKEVESEIDDLPQIAESAVVGVPHPDLGEAVVAVVVVAVTATTPCLKETASSAIDDDDSGGEGNGHFEEKEIIQALSRRLAKFKVPKRVFYRDELPRNSMGKVQKAELRAEYANTFLD